MTTPHSQVGENVGELLRLWVGVKMDQIDELAAEAQVKASAIPSLLVLRQLIGELIINQYALQQEVGDLKTELDRLKGQLRGRRR
jgi:hypothetical protein